MTYLETKKSQPGSAPRRSLPVNPVDDRERRGGALTPWREKALLRPRELAEVSGRSVRTIRRKLETGEIESRLEDGCRLIPIEAALRFVGEEQPETAFGKPTPRIRREVRDFVAKVRAEVG